MSPRHGRSSKFCSLLIATMVVSLMASPPRLSPLAAQDDTEDLVAARDFNTAADLQNNGLYARAAERWRQFLAEHKNDKRLDQATYNLGVCRLHTKKYDEAIGSFNEVLAKHPQFESRDALQYNLGMAHFLKAGDSQQAADYTAAAKAFGEAAEKHPQSKYADRALYFQGEALFTAGSAEASRKAFATLVSKYPQSSLLADAYYALGTAQQEAGLHEEAGKTYAAFLAHNDLKNHEFAAEIRLRLGMSLFERQQYAEAEKHFEQAAGDAEFPHADFALLRQAQCRYEQDDIQKAAELNQSLVRKYPESGYAATARLAAGKCFYRLEKWNEARSALDALAKSDDPARPEAAYWLGKTLLRENKASEALALLEGAANAVAADHEFAPHLKLARLEALYALPERRKETSPLYAQFAQQHPEHELAPQAQYMAALTALEQEEFAAARQHAEAFLGKGDWKASDYHASVLFVAGEAHLLGAEAQEQGAEAAKAESHYRQLVKDYPDDPRAPRSHLRIGWSLYRNGKHAEAAEYLTARLGSLAEAEHQAEARLLIGRSLLDSDKPAEAAAQLEQALKAKNDWSRTDEALILLAQAYRSENKPDDAARQLARLESQFAESPYRGHALYMLGEIAQQAMKWDEAASRYQAVLEKHADDENAALAAYGLGAVRIAQGQYDAAERAFSDLLEKYETAEAAPLARYWRGIARHRQRKFAPAATDLEQFVADARKSSDTPAAARLADALYTIALCQVGQQQLPAAAATLGSLLKDFPDYEHRDKAYYELGHSLLGQEKPAEAVAAFEALAKESPESSLAAEAYFHLGSLREKQAADAEQPDARQQQWSAAAVAYAAGLKSATEAELKEKLQYKLGDMQFRQEKFAEAADTFRSQLEEHPQGSLAGAGRYLAAESLFRQQQHAEALPLFEKVAADKVEPYTARALYRAGASAAALKNWQASEKAYRTLLAQHADFPQAQEARYGLAWSLQNQNQTDEAVKLCEQIASDSLTETAAKARFMVGEIAFGRKAYDEAIEHFLETAAGYPYPVWQGLARLEAGRCFMQLNKPEQARKQFEIVAERFADHPKAADAARLLAELNK